MVQNTHAADAIAREYGPPRNSEAVDISVADHEFAFVTTCLHIGVTGDVDVEEWGNPGVKVVYKNVPVGMFVGRFTKVHMTTTTASEIRGRY